MEGHRRRRIAFVDSAAIIGEFECVQLNQLQRSQDRRVSIYPASGRGHGSRTKTRAKRATLGGFKSASKDVDFGTIVALQENRIGRQSR